jgi:cytosine permease
MTIKNYGIQGIVSYTPEQPLDFITSMGAAVATWVAGAGMAADLTRYSKKASHVWGGSLIGYILGSGIFEAVAVITAIGVGNGNLVIVMSQLGLLIPAVLILAAALWTTTDNNIYSASLAFTNAAHIMGLNIPKWVFCVASDAIALAVAFMGLASKFSSWLSFTGSLCGPLPGMMVAHYLVFNNKKNKVFVPKNFRLSGWLTWIISFIGSQMTSSAIPAVTAIIMGFVVYVVLYYILDIKMSIHKEDVNNPVNGVVWDFPTSKEIEEKIAAEEAAAN